jgi:superfamily II DNA helicase RecQ
VVDLPTSDGKSLVFRAIDALGFASDDEARHGHGGVTLVVVPTIALALDHEANCQSGQIDHPIAYVGGARNANRNQAIRERVTQGIQGLCFAAPEAAVGPLRWPLIQAARRGSLKALVVDEAHLVDAWGTSFRTEFQQLAGLRLELLEASPANQKPRTLLLSATLSESARETLEDLFGKPGRFKVVSAPQVRPEPEFWVASECSVEERDERLSEAIQRTPRPAILYVTKVADANRWYGQLRAFGFRRLGCITGETPSDERKRVLDRWRKGTLDLVVATSAFGLGVDYPYVRTILHACVPESLDRFYQEVGRAGRDGRACLSLIMPAAGDLRIARDLSSRITISIERGLQRWTAMFHHPDRQQISWNRFRVRLDVPPSYDEDEIDMLSGRSTDWNARTLVLMSRSGLIRFCGQVEQEIQRRASEEVAVDEVEGAVSEVRGEYETIEIVDSAHLDKATWEEKVPPVRDRLFAAGQQNLALLDQFLKAEDCPADLVANLYGSDMVDKVCGGCAVCRSDPARKRKPDPRREPVPPWSSACSMAAALTELCDEGRLVVFYEPAAQGRRAERVLRETLRGLVRLGLRLIGLVGAPPNTVEMAIAALTNRPVFVARGTRTFDCRLPEGPRVLIYGKDAAVEPSDLSPRPRDREQLLFVSLEARGAYRRDLLLRDTWSGARISLDDLHGRIGI